MSLRLNIGRDSIRSFNDLREPTRRWCGHFGHCLVIACAARFRQHRDSTTLFRAMPIHLGSPTIVAAAADSSAPAPIPEEEEFYSSWSLFLVCLLLILSLWTSYYLQIKRIRAIHETVVSIVAGMVVGFIVRLAPGHLIREMLVSHTPPRSLQPVFFSFLSRVTRVFFLCLTSRWRCSSGQKREGRESRPSPLRLPLVVSRGF